MRFFNYMRASLNDISINGGTLFTPLFARGFSEDVQPANDLSSVMWGQAIKVDLQFKQFFSEKEVRFPPSTKWVNLNTWDTLVAPTDSYLSQFIKTSLSDPVSMFQLFGTVVSLQDTSTYPV
jgi:hypothetical protein